MPDFSVMEGRLRDYESAVELFESARGAVTARRKPGRISGVPTCTEHGHVLLDEEILSQIMVNFDQYFEHSKSGVRPDNEFITDKALIEKSPEIVARQLGHVAASGAINLMPMIYRNKRRFRTAA